MNSHANTSLPPACINSLLNKAIRNIKDVKFSKNIVWPEFNPTKELIPIGPSGKVFLNMNPFQLRGKWEKDQPEGADFFYIHNQPLFRLAGMIYWYTIGEYQFDIRSMRRRAKFPKDDYAADHDFQNPLKGLALVAKQWDIILQKYESHYDFLSQFEVVETVVKSNSRTLPF